MIFGASLRRKKEIWELDVGESTISICVIFKPLKALPVVLAWSIPLVRLEPQITENFEN